MHAVAAYRRHEPAAVTFGDVIMNSADIVVGIRSLRRACNCRLVSEVGSSVELLRCNCVQCGHDLSIIIWLNFVRNCAVLGCFIAANMIFSVSNFVLVHFIAILCRCYCWRRIAFTKSFDTRSCILCFSLKKRRYKYVIIISKQYINSRICRFRKKCCYICSLIAHNNKHVAVYCIHKNNKRTRNCIMNTTMHNAIILFIASQAQRCS